MRIVLFLCLALLASCTSPNAVRFSNNAEVGNIVPIFVGTTRVPGEAGDFSSKLASETNYLRYDVSIPPSHTPGNIEWAKRARPNPETEFAATAKYTYQNDASFRGAIQNAMRQRGSKRVYVYVHGYLNTFGDGLYRAAQISNDFSLDSVVAHFAWPSAASPFGYAQDRDAALTARDSFEEYLRTIKAAGAEEIVIVAHSLGSALTMEVMRTLAKNDPSEVPRLIKGVLLIAPDIDVDLFVSQAEPITQMPDFFMIFTSARDRAMQLSSAVAGGKPRLGNIQDLTPIQHLDVLVWDISELNGIQKSNHLAAFENPETLEFFELIRANSSILSVSGTEAAIPNTAVLLLNRSQAALTPQN
ncbi:alpha/beta hydrolase [Falsihalocynthiibacter sp. SS001]|uniref:alpha/beta hydrolase n=1 Tax=Falsihalocynthiibacter sp. SS001 TaxID=3349698 RepID=UPI0036D2649B